MINKKYSAQYKIEKVTEYLEEVKTKKITKAEFASKNGISDSTFNDWVLKYQREQNGFCNVTKEIIKLNDVEVIDTEQFLVRNYSLEENINYIREKDYLRLHYNGAVIEFNKCILDKVLAIIRRW